MNAIGFCDKFGIKIPYEKVFKDWKSP